MDLKSGYPFWPIRSGLIGVYPALSADARCDVAVIGGGVTGALLADSLTEAGLSVVLLDRRDIGSGSTAASTALLQYEVDTPLTDLIKLVGAAHANRSYRLCLESIETLAGIVATLDHPCGFARKKSLYFASTPRDVPELEAELVARREIGIELELLDAEAIGQRFSFSAPAALLSATAAQVDAYQLTHALLRRAAGRGAQIYDRTTVTEIENDLAGVLLQTDRGVSVRARRVVFAAGFEAQERLRQKVVTFRATYALVSEPLAAFPGWGEEQCLIWESARPYIYMRTTDDGRALVGGEDDAFDSEARRDRRLPQKTERLTRRFAEMFPAIPLEVPYSWAGTFGETKDGLAYIGATPEYPKAYFALGYGGNGITYSVVAAQLIRDLIEGRPNPDAAVFRFDR